MYILPKTEKKNDSCTFNHITCTFCITKFFIRVYIDRELSNDLSWLSQLPSHFPMALRMFQSVVQTRERSGSTRRIFRSRFQALQAASIWIERLPESSRQY